MFSLLLGVCLPVVWCGFAHRECPNLAAAAHGRAHGLYLRSSSSHPEYDLSQTWSENMEGGGFPPTVCFRVCCQSRSCSRIARSRAIYTIVSPRKRSESQYMDDTDKVPRKGFPMRRLLRRRWRGAFYLQGRILTTTLPARSS
jgi:hypothetical protein